MEVGRLPRPMKCRRVCCLPDNSSFGPLEMRTGMNERVMMTVDEYEAIRLIDLENFTQEECAKQMNIARTTVQGIYSDARKKLAESLVNGAILRIEGGEYRLCDGNGEACGAGCRRYRFGKGCGRDNQAMHRICIANGGYV